MRTILAVAIALALGACSEDLDKQHQRLAKHVRENKIGSSQDFWLVKHNMFGEFERVGLIFGFMDDREFCEEISALYMRKFPADRYSCAPAN